MRTAQSAQFRAEVLESILGGQPGQKGEFLAQQVPADHGIRAALRAFACQAVDEIRRPGFRQQGQRLSILVLLYGCQRKGAGS
ncbi:MAG: hypothetical protein Fur0037_25610 [Planctomycetota bacterium]